MSRIVVILGADLTIDPSHKGRNDRGKIGLGTGVDMSLRRGVMSIHHTPGKIYRH